MMHLQRMNVKICTDQFWFLAHMCMHLINISLPYEIFASVLELQCHPEKKEKKRKELQFLNSHWCIVKQASAKPCKLSYYANQDKCKTKKIHVTHYF